MKTMAALLGAVTLAFAPGARAQSVTGSGGSVQMVSYTIARSGVEKTISELVVPVAAVMTFGERFSVDVATGYASARVDITGSGTTQRSTIAGLTDTQLRASYMLGQDAVVLTAGVNLPSGRSTADSAEFLAAGQIANDFLLFPIGSFGSGLGGTVGIAVARPLGAWNVGAGASYRHSMAFEPYEYADGSRARYEPGDEIRARLGIDRLGQRGRFALGASWSTFAEDASGGGANRVAFNTGDRLTLQGSYDALVAGGRWSLAAWTLMRTEGARADRSIAPRENISSATLGAGYGIRAVTFEPSLEHRIFDRAASSATPLATAQPNERGSMTVASARARWTTGALQVVPSVGYALGSIGGFDLTGFRAALVVRLAP
jgi:hypothetical protein